MRAVKETGKELEYVRNGISSLPSHFPPITPAATPGTFGGTILFFPAYQIG